MKKWKVLNDSDKSSNSSKNSRPVKQQINTIYHEVKTHSKPYVPLKRSKGGNSFTSIRSLRNSGAISNISQKYIKAIQLKSPSVKSSQKMKTQEFDGEGIQLGLKSLEDIQNVHTSGLNFSDRPSSLMLKKQNQNRWQQRHTQRYFVKQKSMQIEVKQFNPIQTPFKKKSKQQNIQNFKQNLRVLTKQKDKLKQTVVEEFKKLGSEFQQESNRWSAKMQKFEHLLKKKTQEQGQFMQKFMQQYSKYKPKIDQLQEQKQVFLQTLIRMAPL